MADKDDQSQIAFVDFMKAVSMFGGRLSKEESESLLTALPGQEGGNKGARMNIARLFD